MARVFTMQITSCCFFLSGMERAHCDRMLLVLDKKIPDWLTKIMFLVDAETAIRADIKSRFGIMGF